MQMITKNFRLPKKMADFIRQQAESSKMTESEILERAVRELMAFHRQWQRDLRIAATDVEYQKEQRELAEELYD